jgi:hypothetical protein
MPTLNLQVGASTDDANQQYGNSPPTFLPTTLLTNNFGGLNYNAWTIGAAGYRFANVTIPKGATINVAYLEHWVAPADWSAAPNLNIYGQLIKDAPTFSSADYDVSGRTRTGASVLWKHDENYPFGAWCQSPSLVSIIQEIIDQSEWASGNALVILEQQVTGEGGLLCSHYYDADPQYAEKLHIEYTAGTGGITGAGSIEFPVSPVAGVGKLGFLATAALAFGLAMAGAGVQEFVGTGGASFSHTQVGVGEQRFIGAGGPAFLPALSAIGSERFAGTAGVAFLPGLSGNASQAFRGISDLGYSFGLAVQGAERFNGTGAVAFGPSLSGAGVERFTAAAGLSHPFALDGQGIAGIPPISGTGNLAFVESLAGQGTIYFQYFTGSGDLSYPVSLAGTGSQRFSGSANLAFGANLVGQGTERFVGSSALPFGLSMSGSGTEHFCGSGRLLFSPALAGSGEQRFVGQGGLVYGFPVVGQGFFRLQPVYAQSQCQSRMEDSPNWGALPPELLEAAMIPLAPPDDPVAPLSFETPSFPRWLGSLASRAWQGVRGLFA